MTDHHCSVLVDAEGPGLNSSGLTGVLRDSWPTTGDVLPWDSIFNNTMTMPTLSQPPVDSHDAQSSDLVAWMNDFLEDPIIGWVGWDSRV